MPSTEGRNEKWLVFTSAEYTNEVLLQLIEMLISKESRCSQTTSHALNYSLYSAVAPNDDIDRACFPSAQKYTEVGLLLKCSYILFIFGARRFHINTSVIPLFTTPKFFFHLSSAKLNLFLLLMHRLPASQSGVYSVVSPHRVTRVAHHAHTAEEYYGSDNTEFATGTRIRIHGTQSGQIWRRHVQQNASIFNAA